MPPVSISKPVRRGQNGSRHLNAAFTPATLPTFTVATVPSAATYPRQLIHVSDGAAGAPCLGFSDGTNWKQIAIGATISAT